MDRADIRACFSAIVFIMMVVRLSECLRRLMNSRPNGLAMSDRFRVAMVEARQGEIAELIIAGLI